MNFKRLLNTDIGRSFVSVLLGLGLASLFRKVCTDKGCIRFNGPIITDIEEKVYKHGEKCYTYETNSDKCDPAKRNVEISTHSEE